jgi:hypothetical protein
MKKSQNQLVLDHLVDHGYITEIIARSYGVRRLASRIHELKMIGGVDVKRDMRTDDLGVPYAYYYLTQEVREAERCTRSQGLNWNLVKAAA